MKYFLNTIQIINKSLVYYDQNLEFSESTNIISEFKLKNPKEELI